jgi:hypothetical protein
VYSGRFARVAAWFYLLLPEQRLPVRADPRQLANGDLPYNNQEKETFQ